MTDDQYAAAVEQTTASLERLVASLPPEEAEQRADWIAEQRAALAELRP